MPCHDASLSTYGLKSLKKYNYIVNSIKFQFPYLAFGNSLIHEIHKRPFTDKTRRITKKESYNIILIRAMASLPKNKNTGGY